MEFKSKPFMIALKNASQFIDPKDRPELCGVHFHAEDMTRPYLEATDRKIIGRVYLAERWTEERTIDRYWSLGKVKGWLAEKPDVFEPLLMLNSLDPWPCLDRAVESGQNRSTDPDAPLTIGTLLLARLGKLKWPNGRTGPGIRFHGNGDGKTIGFSATLPYGDEDPWLVGALMTIRNV